MLVVQKIQQIWEENVFNIFNFMAKRSLHWLQFYFLRGVLIIPIQRTYFFFISVHICVTACHGMYMHVESRDQPWLSTSVTSSPSPFYLSPLTESLGFRLLSLFFYYYFYFLFCCYFHTGLAFLLLPSSIYRPTARF